MDTNVNISIAESNHHQDLLKMLKVAVTVGDIIIVEEILKREPPLNNQTGGELIWLAVSRNEVKIASTLIKAGADIEVPNPIDKSEYLLHHLMKRREKNYHDLAILIMERGANVNILDRYSMSPLDYAIPFKAPIKLIKELLKHGAVYEWDILRFTYRYKKKEAEVVSLFVGDAIETRAQRVVDALCYYADKTPVDENDILPIVEILLTMSPIAKLKTHGCILIGAIRAAKIQMVRLLILYGFDMNRASMPGGETPLYTSIFLQQSAITEFLIQVGTDVNGLSKDGTTYAAYPIHAACQTMSIKMIELLLDHGADLRVTDSRGRTPFSLMEISDKVGQVHQIVIKHLAILMSNGENINEDDLNALERHDEMNAYYMQCLKELKKI